MTDLKTSNRHARHPYCKKGYEPGTEKNKRARESAAAILAKNQQETTTEEKAKLAEIWDHLFYEEALIKLVKWHGANESKEPPNSKKTAIADLVDQWRAIPDDDTWNVVMIHDAEMPESPPQETGEENSRDEDNHVRNRGRHRSTSPPRSSSRSRSPRRSRSRSRSRSVSRSRPRQYGPRRESSSNRRRSRSRSRPRHARDEKSELAEQLERTRETIEKMKQQMAELKKSVEAKEKTWVAQRYPSKLVEKAIRDEFIDLTELREDNLYKQRNQDQVLLKTGSTQLICRDEEASSTSKKGDVSTVLEFLALSHTLIDLYRHAGQRCLKRKDCAIKHFKFCSGLLLQNHHQIVSIFAYDKAMRQIKAGSFNWSYDEAIGVANLKIWIPKAEKTVVTTTKKVRKRGERDSSSYKSQEICYKYAQGNCHRSQGECRFQHKCTACGTGPSDTHVLAKCVNKAKAQRPANGARSA